jgi:hypothetical protein
LEEVVAEFKVERVVEVSLLHPDGVATAYVRFLEALQAAGGSAGGEYVAAARPPDT